MSIYDEPSRKIVLALAERIHRWRFITGGRRAELVILLDDLLNEIERLESR